MFNNLNSIYKPSLEEYYSIEIIIEKIGEFDIKENFITESKEKFQEDILFKGNRYIISHQNEDTYIKKLNTTQPYVTKN